MQDQVALSKNNLHTCPNLIPGFGSNGCFGSLFCVCRSEKSFRSNFQFHGVLGLLKSVIILLPSFQNIFWDACNFSILINIYSINPKNIHSDQINFLNEFFYITTLSMLTITCLTHTVINLIFSSNSSSEYFLTINSSFQRRAHCTSAIIKYETKWLLNLYAYVWKSWPLWKYTKQISRECGRKCQHYKCEFETSYLALRRRLHSNTGSGYLTFLLYSNKAEIGLAVWMTE